MSLNKSNLLGDSISNRSDIKLINNDQSDLVSRVSQVEKEEKERKEKKGTDNNKDDEQGENDVKIIISESLSEVSANDYGYFTLKVNDEREEKLFKGSKVKKGFLGVLNSAIRGELELSLKKNNFINLLNKDAVDMNSGKKYKLIKNDFELLMHLGRDENDYKNFKITNPNEEIYKKMVFLNKTVVLQT
jgi:hypothetical protein